MVDVVIGFSWGQGLCVCVCMYVCMYVYVCRRVKECVREGISADDI